MVRFAFQRLLWAIPTLFGISLVVFALTTLIPEPSGLAAAEAEALASGDFGELDRLDDERRARALDLPRFINPRPIDVRGHTERLVGTIAEGGPSAGLAAHRLARIGGAALPHVLPGLDELPPAARGRVAVALAPIGTRMGVGTREELRDPERAIVFWTHFWNDRALDFTEPAVRRTVTRAARRATDARIRDLVLVDTFALPALVEAMPDASDEALAQFTRLTMRATGRGPAFHDGEDEETRRRVIATWREFWFTNRDLYSTFSGTERVIATLGQTRYGLWAGRLGTGQLGVSARDGEPIARKLRERAPVTLLVTGIAMLVSFALAVPIGVVTAVRRSQTFDLAAAAILFALYSLPTFLVAQLLAVVVAGRADAALFDFGVGFRVALPVLALTPFALASLSRHQRAAVLEVLRLDYVRTARAKGLSPFRVLVVHALRNATIPLVTLAGLQIPTLLGGALVVEEVFELPGLGYETLRAVEAHDAAWLMATILLAAVFATLALVVSDLAYGVLDPRVRDSFGSRMGEEA
jgi:ABC-type dipeptide/oligopeptide/nickel transport system permease component